MFDFWPFNIRHKRQQRQEIMDAWQNCIADPMFIKWARSLNSILEEDPAASRTVREAAFYLRSAEAVDSQLQCARNLKDLTEIHFRLLDSFRISGTYISQMHKDLGLS